MLITHRTEGDFDDLLGEKAAEIQRVLDEQWNGEQEMGSDPLPGKPLAAFTLGAGPYLLRLHQKRYWHATPAGSVPELMNCCAALRRAASSLAGEVRGELCGELHRALQDACCRTEEMVRAAEASVPYEGRNRGSTAVPGKVPWDGFRLLVQAALPEERLLRTWADFGTALGGLQLQLYERTPSEPLPDLAALVNLAKALPKHHAAHVSALGRLASIGPDLTARGPRSTLEVAFLGSDEAEQNKKFGPENDSFVLNRLLSALERHILQGLATLPASASEADERSVRADKRDGPPLPSDLPKPGYLGIIPDEDRRAVLRAGNKAEFRGNKILWNVFRTLYRFTDTYCSRNDLIRQVWSDDGRAPEDNTIIVAITGVRNLLVPLGLKVHYTRNAGYRLEQDKDLV